MIMLLLGIVSLVAIPLEMYDGGPGYMLLVGILMALVGFVGVLIGAGLFIFSLMVGDVAEPQ